MTARLVQVTNVSTSVTKEQLKSLFTHLGRIEDIQLYPESDILSQSYNAKVGYIRFASSDTAQAALNLTNTVFLDRPILCSLVQYPHRSSSSSSSSSQSYRIPDEQESLRYCPHLNPNISLIANGVTWPHTVINRIVNSQATNTTKHHSYIETLDPALIERSLPAYPNLPGTTEQPKAEEIRRTVYVSDLDPRVTLLDLYDLFSQIGEIRYIKLTSPSQNGIEYEHLGLLNLAGPADVECSADSIGAFIEFSEQPSVVKALCLNGLSFAHRHIKVSHSLTAISVPTLNTSKQIVLVDDLRKELAAAEKLQRHSSSSSSSRAHNHHTSSSGSSNRHRDTADTRSSNHRETSSSTKSVSHSHSRSHSHTATATSKPKRDGSSGSTPNTQSDDELHQLPEDEEATAAVGNEDDEKMSTASSPPPRKQARRSRSDSRSKQRTSSSRHHHKSPTKASQTTSTSTSNSHKHASSSHSSLTSTSKHRASRSRSREHKSSSASRHHHKSSSSRRDGSPTVSSSSKSKKQASNGDAEKSRKRSHSKSRKRSKSKEKKSKDKDKDKEKEKKSSKSDRKRSKSKEKNTSSSSRHHHHRHKSSSSKGKFSFIIYLILNCSVIN